MKRRFASLLRPVRIRRTMFSSITTASSTTKPTDNVKAISDELSRPKCKAAIAANVPTMEASRASVGMIVARMLRQKEKDHQNHEGNREQQGELYIIDRLANRDRAVVTTSRLTDAGSCSRN